MSDLSDDRLDVLYGLPGDACEDDVECMIAELQRRRYQALTADEVTKVVVGEFKKEPWLTYEDGGVGGINMTAIGTRVAAQLAGRSVTLSTEERRVVQDWRGDLATECECECDADSQLLLVLLDRLLQPDGRHS